MSLAKLTSRAGDTIQESVAGLDIKEMHWTRVVAAASFVASVGLLIGGKRKAALVLPCRKTVRTWSKTLRRRTRSQKLHGLRTQSLRR